MGKNTFVMRFKSKRFMKAVKKENMEVLRECLKSGVDVNSKDKYGKTALLYACERNLPDVVRELLFQKADVTAADRQGWFPLLRAADSGHLEILEVLLDNEAEVNTITESVGRFPLRQAAFWGHTKCVQYLLEKGAIVNKLDHRHGTALFMAVQNGHQESVDLLLKAGALPNISLIDGTSPVFVAARKGHKSVLRSLLAYGASIEIKHDSGKTALIKACEFHWSSIVQMLCKAGSNINAADGAGNTPLHFAANNGYIDLTKYLCQQGAIIMENKHQREPIYYARKGKYIEIIKLLDSYASQLPRNYQKDISVLSESGVNLNVKIQPEKHQTLDESDMEESGTNGVKSGIKTLTKPGVERQTDDKGDAVGETESDNLSQIVDEKLHVKPLSKSEDVKESNEASSDKPSSQVAQSAEKSDVKLPKSKLEDAKESNEAQNDEPLSQVVESGEQSDVKPQSKPQALRHPEAGDFRTTARPTEPLDNVRNLWQHISNISVDTTTKVDAISEQLHTKKDLTEEIASKLGNKWRILFQFLDIPQNQITKLDEVIEERSWKVVVEWRQCREGSEKVEGEEVGASTAEKDIGNVKKDTIDTGMNECQVLKQAVIKIDIR